MQPPLAGASSRRFGVGGWRREWSNDAIATDPAPHPGSEKMTEFESCPFGILFWRQAIG